MKTDRFKSSIYERIFIPMFILASFVVGVFAFGALIPIAFILVPVIAVPLFIYFYSYKFRQKRSSFSAQVRELNKRRGVAMYSNEEKQDMVDESGLEMTIGQIDEITANDLAELTEQMPADGSAVQHFAPLGAHQWIYRFHFKSVAAEFNAIGVGVDPKEAFCAAKKVIQKQIEEWRIARDHSVYYIGVDQADLLRRLTNVMNIRSDEKKELKRGPTVLIVEDDIDVAQATEAIFKKLGCKTMISNGHDGTAHKMSFQHVDFIVLDWVLGNNLFADQLLKGSNRIIDAFKDLRSHFRRQRAKVITYSVLDRTQTELPESRYFEHIDHWQKPSQYADLMTRASKLLIANGY